VPIVCADVDPPIEGIVCTREVGVAMVGSAAMPTVGCIEAPIAGSDEGALVVPIVGVVDMRLVLAPTVESVVPVADVAVANPVESVVVAELVVLSDVIRGNIPAEGPIPSLAAKELKSVAAPNPRVASKASKSGSTAAGMITPMSGGKLNVVVLGTIDTVVPKAPDAPPAAVPVVNVEVCANAAQGIAMSAAGAIHPKILFIPPPCPNLDIRIDHRRARVVPRGAWDKRTIRSKSFRSAFVRV
jgi:hypothetical protein